MSDQSDIDALIERLPVKYTGTNQGKYAFHFVGDTLRGGRPIPADGVWLEHEVDIRICKSGLHASWEVADALAHAPGDTLCLVEVDGIVEEQSDKLVARRRKIVARFDAADLLIADARESAKSVLKHWTTPVPQVVLDWLNTGDVRYREDAYRAAHSAADSAAYFAALSAAYSAVRAAAPYFAARAAAYSAARSAASCATYCAADYSAADYSAACAAALSAAYSAACSAARKRLHYAVMAKFEETGVISK
jgi:hypothetical protein